MQENITTKNLQNTFSQSKNENTEPIGLPQFDNFAPYHVGLVAEGIQYEKEVGLKNPKLGENKKPIEKKIYYINSNKDKFKIFEGGENNNKQTNTNKKNNQVRNDEEQKVKVYSYGKNGSYVKSSTRKLLRGKKRLLRYYDKNGKFISNAVAFTDPANFKRYVNILKTQGATKDKLFNQQQKKILPFEYKSDHRVSINNNVARYMKEVNDKEKKELKEEIITQNAPSPKYYVPNSKGEFPILNLSTRLSNDLEKNIKSMENAEIFGLKDKQYKNLKEKITDNIISDYNLDPETNIKKIRLPNINSGKKTHLQNIANRKTILSLKQPATSTTSIFVENLPDLFKSHNKDIKKADDFISMYEENSTFRKWINEMWGVMYRGSDVDKDESKLETNITGLIAQLEDKNKTKAEKEVIKTQIDTLKKGIKVSTKVKKLAELHKTYIQKTFDYRCLNKNKESFYDYKFHSGHNADKAGVKCCSLFPSGHFAHAPMDGKVTSGAENNVCGYAFINATPTNIKIPDGWTSSKYHEKIKPFQDKKAEIKKALEIGEKILGIEKIKDENYTDTEIQKIKQNTDLSDTQKKDKIKEYKTQLIQNIENNIDKDERTEFRNQSIDLFFNTIDTIRRTRAVFRGKSGPEVLQALYDTVKSKLPEHLKPFLPTLHFFLHEKKIRRTRYVQPLIAQKIKEGLQSKKNKNTSGINKNKIKLTMNEKKTIKNSILQSEDEKIKAIVSTKYINKKNGTRKSVASKMLEWTFPVVKVGSYKNRTFDPLKNDNLKKLQIIKNIQKPKATQGGQRNFTRKIRKV